MRKNIVDSYRDLCSSKASLISSSAPQVALETLKELLMNAYVHRCYRISSGVVVTANLDEVSIQSPGSLAAGLNANNILYGVPVYRNLLLADGCRFVGLCDKVGQGIDMIYRAVLTEGFDFPIFENEPGSFTATISTKGSVHFREFVRKRTQSLSRLDDIVALRILFSNEKASLAELASGMQRGKEQTRRILVEMIEKAMITSDSEGYYALSPVVRSDIENVFNSAQLLIGLDLYGDGFAVS
jgi:ATP-dependent DNA helicase RecG